MEGLPKVPAGAGKLAAKLFLDVGPRTPAELQPRSPASPPSLAPFARYAPLLPMLEQGALPILPMRLKADAAGHAPRPAPGARQWWRRRRALPTCAASMGSTAPFKSASPPSRIKSATRLWYAP